LDSARSQFAQITKKITSQGEVVQDYESSDLGDNSGWWPYFIITIITAPLGGIIAHFCKPGKHKHKGWGGNL